MLTETAINTSDSVALPSKVDQQPVLSIVVPTRNEAGNIEPLLNRISTAIPAMPIEVIFVDDSSDNTPEIIEKVMQNFTFGIRVIHRPVERHNGLGNAVVEGMRIARSEWVCVMDGDLQHPPEVIPNLLEIARTKQVDLVAASRLAEGGGVDGLSWRRVLVSRALAIGSRALFPRALANVSDPLTGFFVFRRSAVNVDLLAPKGFKILLEVLIRCPKLKVTEMPFKFAERHSEKSKANVDQVVSLFEQLLGLRLKSYANLAKSVSVSAISDRLIGKSGSPKMATYYYNIHDIISIRSAQRLPELGYFQTQEPITNPDIDVLIDRNVASYKQPNSITYHEVFGRFGFDVLINRDEKQSKVVASSLVGISPHVLYTNVVEPLLRWSFVRKGYALMHGACISFDGQALFITARTDTGKTTTILNLIRNNRQSIGFLSDDMTIFSRDGEVMNYPKPLTISQHTVQAIGGAPLTRTERAFLKIQSRLHSREGRKVAMWLTEGRFPAATLNAIVQFIVPPPKYMVDRLVPGAQFQKRAQLALIAVIERGPDFVVDLDERKKVDTLLANAEDAYGFPPYPAIANALSNWNGVDLHQQEREVVAAAIDQLPGVHIASPRYDWYKTLPMRVQALTPKIPAPVELRPVIQGAVQA